MDSRSVAACCNGFKLRWRAAMDSSCAGRVRLGRERGPAGSPLPARAACARLAVNLRTQSRPFPVLAAPGKACRHPFRVPRFRALGQNGVAVQTERRKGPWDFDRRRRDPPGLGIRARWEIIEGFAGAGPAGDPPMCICARRELALAGSWRAQVVRIPNHKFRAPCSRRKYRGQRQRGERQTSVGACPWHSPHHGIAWPAVMPGRNAPSLPSRLSACPGIPSYSHLILAAGLINRLVVAMDSITNSQSHRLDQQARRPSTARLRVRVEPLP